MSWCGIEGHDAVVERFRRSVQRGRLGSAFLFLGPPGIGKRLFSLRLAQALLCDMRPESSFDPCLECAACQQVAAESHADVEFVCRPPDASTIPIRVFVGEMEHRMREGLCHRISLRPSSGQRRIAIIDDADYLSDASANCLLKTLEEPPPGAVIILIGTSQQRQLPTIRSRCQIVRFHALSDSFVRHYIEQHAELDDSQQVDQIIELAAGSLQRAREYADPELIGFMRELHRDWAQSPVNSIRIAQDIRQFVDGAGSDAPPRRARLRQVVRSTMWRLRHELHAAVGAPATSAPDDEVIANRVDRCLIALNQIDANANLATLIECWVDEMTWS